MILFILYLVLFGLFVLAFGFFFFQVEAWKPDERLLTIPLVRSRAGPVSSSDQVADDGVSSSHRMCLPSCTFSLILLSGRTEGGLKQSSLSAETTDRVNEKET